MYLKNNIVELWGVPDACEVLLLADLMGIPVRDNNCFPEEIKKPKGLRPLTINSLKVMNLI